MAHLYDSPEDLAQSIIMQLNDTNSTADESDPCARIAAVPTTQDLFRGETIFFAYYFFVQYFTVLIL